MRYTKEQYKQMALGWYGIPGANGRGSTKTHLVNRFGQNERQPICGAKLSPKQRFQWCTGCPTDYVPECKKCREIQMKINKGKS
jgi:hypothetical protein